jgi:multidrug efflux system membrane fusion protein
MIEQSSTPPEHRGDPSPGPAPSGAAPQNIEKPHSRPSTAIPPLPPPGPPSKYRWVWWLLLIAVAAVIYLNRAAIEKFISPPDTATKGGGKKGGKGGGGAGGSAPVVATRATRGNIGVYFNGLGSITPIYTATIQSRVVGELMNIRYKEGDMVHKGDPLIEIDPRPYEVALEQAQGQMARDQASLDNARVDQTRYEGLLKQNAIPEQQVATQIATVKQDEGIVKSDQGAIDMAKLNLTYCKIDAPITGRLGLRLVDPGNIVQTTTNLVVITQIDPISVVFPLPEIQLQPVISRMQKGEKLSVDALGETTKTKLATGTLTTVDNEIDQSTGTFRLRAVFDNKNNVLFPNQFVNVRLLVQQKTGIVLLNSAAIQRTENQIYVFLIKPDNTVTQRNIALGVENGDQTEITSGLNAGDAVVLTGVDRLQEGSKVTVQFEGQNGGGRSGANANASAGNGQTAPSAAAANSNSTKHGSGRTGKGSGKNSRGENKQ